MLSLKARYALTRIKSLSYHCINTCSGYSRIRHIIIILLVITHIHIFFGIYRYQIIVPSKMPVHIRTRNFALGATIKVMI